MNGLREGTKLFVELYIETEEQDITIKHIVAESEDKDLWLEVLHRVIEKEGKKQRKTEKESKG